MAKITVTLSAEYDDGKSVKAPGDTVSMDDKLAKQLAALGMVKLPAKEAKETKATEESKQARQPKNNAAKAAAAAPDADAEGADPAASDLDPDAMSDDGE